MEGHAQQDSTGAATSSFAVFATVVGVTAIGGGIVLTTLLSSGGDDGSDAKEEKANFIRRNAISLKRDLTIGEGPTIQALAAAFSIDRARRDAFGRLLQRRRNELVPLTKLAELDRERAAKFFRIIVRSMRNHPTLREDLRELPVAAT